MKQFEDFITDCLKGFCNRRTMYNDKTCKTESKHKVCYKKYCEKIQKDKQKLKFKGFNSTYEITEKDYKWEELKEYIKDRDITCLFIKIATLEEMKILESKEGWWLSKFIDGAHIISRAEAPSQIYNKNNVILLNRYVHSMLDNFKNPITEEFIGEEGKALWFTRIMQENRRWSEGYTYWDFKRDLMNLN